MTIADNNRICLALQQMNGRPSLTSPWLCGIEVGDLCSCFSSIREFAGPAVAAGCGGREFSYRIFQLFSGRRGKVGSATGIAGFKSRCQKTI